MCVYMYIYIYVCVRVCVCVCLCVCVKVTLLLSASWMHIGGADVQLHSFLTKTLHRCKLCSASRPGHFTADKDPCTHWTDGRGDPSAALNVSPQKSVACGGNSTSDRPAHKSNWATPAPDTYIHTYIYIYIYIYITDRPYKKVCTPVTHQDSDAIRPQYWAASVSLRTFLIPRRSRSEHPLYFYHPLPPSHALYLPCCVHWFTSPLVSC